MPLIISRQLSTEIRASAQEGDDKSPPNRRELDPSLPRFGPCCGEDSDAIKHAKNEAWEHIVAYTPGDDEESVRGTYLSAIKKVEEEVRKIYPLKALDGLGKSRFYRKMVNDGCFFLQWAFSVLGGSELLAYPPNHLYFGKNINERWIEAMFFVGNQIPYVVLRELLKQTFFQDIIKRGMQKGVWIDPPSDNLPKRVLYQLLVSPGLSENNSPSDNLLMMLRHQVHQLRVSARLSENGIFHRRKGKESSFPENPSDLLNAAYCWVIGSSEKEDDDDDDFVDEQEEAHIEEPDWKERFPSAMDLHQSGVRFNEAKWGIRNIFFTKRVRRRLCMSPFIFDGNSELMLQYLKDYEATQKRDKNTHEVASYLSIMKDLVRTTKDVELLESERIIILKDMDKNKLPQILKRLCSSEAIPLTTNFRQLKMRAKHYTSTERWSVNINVSFKRPDK